MSKPPTLLSWQHKLLAIADEVDLLGDPVLAARIRDVANDIEMRAECVRVIPGEFARPTRGKSWRDRIEESARRRRERREGKPQ